MHKYELSYLQDVYTILLYNTNTSQHVTLTKLLEEKWTTWRYIVVIKNLAANGLEKSKNTTRWEKNVAVLLSPF